MVWAVRESINSIAFSIVSPTIWIMFVMLFRTGISTMYVYWIYRDAEQLFQYTIKESNQFHATCLDSDPSIIYLNARSIQFIQLINALNQYYHHPIVCPSPPSSQRIRSATLMTPEPTLSSLPLPSTTTISCISCLTSTSYLTLHCIHSFLFSHLRPLNESSVSSTIRSFYDQYSSFLPESVYDILCTKGGDGPQVMDLQYHP